MFRTITTITGLTAAMALGAWGISETRAAQPAEEQAEQIEQEAQEIEKQAEQLQKEGEQVKKEGKQKYSQKEKTGKGTMQQVMKDDIREWMTAWNNLDPQDRTVLIAAAGTAVQEVEALSEQQKQTLMKGLEALAKNPDAQFQDLSDEQKQAVREGMRTLQDMYLALDTERKSDLMAELAQGIRVGSQAPYPMEEGQPGMQQPGTPPSPPME